MPFYAAAVDVVVAEFEFEPVYVYDMVSEETSGKALVLAEL